MSMLILGTLIIFWIADSYIAKNKLVHSCLNSKQHNILTLIYDTIIKNKK
jgi:hypothetical protein